MERFTLVAWHAHPDDEALLTGGTLAKAAAEGHRVVLVVATAGEAGLAAGRPAAAALAARRQAELHRSAAALGCHRVVLLGYGDSGVDGAADAGTFSRADPGEVAARLAEILVAERADVLTSYDPAGGYGHPDHQMVHRVAGRAADLAGTPVLLEATVDRDLLRRALALARRMYRFPAQFDAARFAAGYTPRAELTHRVGVRRYLAQKRAALAAHASQASSDGEARTLAAVLRLPAPLFALAFGREWYVERGRRPARRLLDDVFATVREAVR